MRISDWSSDVCSSDLPVDRLENGDAFAKLGQDRRCLQPDIAAANHHCVFDCRQLARDSIDVATRADRVNANNVMPLACQPSRRAPRCPDQLAVTKTDRKSTRLNSSNSCEHRMPSSA